MIRQPESVRVAQSRLTSVRWHISQRPALRIISLSVWRDSILLQSEGDTGHCPRVCWDAWLCWKLEGCCSCRPGWLAGDSEGAGLVYLAHHTQYSPNTGHLNTGTSHHTPLVYTPLTSRTVHCDTPPCDTRQTSCTRQRQWQSGVEHLRLTGLDTE